ncbi:MAG: XRE family transcriptional regulator [Clostridia bacterium]
MFVGHRMKERRKALGMSAETLAARLGLSAATIYRYEKGDIEKLPGNLLEPLASILSTTPADLMGWESPYQGMEGILPVIRKKIPLLGEIAAGQPIFAQEDYNTSVTCNEDVPCDFALRVKGDSMNPRLFDNDVVFIRSQPDVHDGQIAAVMVDDSATLKHVYHIAGGVQLVSDNADYAPMTFTSHNSESITILGLAVAYQRRLNQRQS